MAKSRAILPEASLDSTKIFVGGIPFTVSSTEFIRYFASYGKVKNFILPADLQQKTLNCGYGFVNYRDYESLSSLLGEGRHFLRAKEVIL